MNAIYKYTLEIADRQSVLMPKGAKILTAQLQGGEIVLWAVVETEQPEQSRTIEIIGTGNEIREAEGFVVLVHEYIATVQQSQYVWHIFELLRKS